MVFDPKRFDVFIKQVQDTKSLIEQNRKVLERAQAQIREALEAAEKAGEKYLELKAEQDETKAELENTKTDLSNTKDDLEQAKLLLHEIDVLTDDIQALAQTAKDRADAVGEEVSAVVAELETAQAELDTVKANLETVTTELSANYATKGELTEVNTTLDTAIKQNAANIESTAKEVQTVKVDVSQAKIDAETAKQNAADAQTAAGIADSKAAQAQADYAELKKQADATDEALAAAKVVADRADANATIAQEAADTAKANAEDAQKKYSILQAQADATDEELEAAKADLTKAKEDAVAAQTAADEAKANAADAQSKYTALKAQADTTDENLAAAKELVDKAQADATAAQAAADEAKASASALDSRVTTAETNIQQNAQQIGLRATKDEVATAKSEAITESKNYADAQIQISTESITQSVSETYATKTALAETDNKITNLSIGGRNLLRHTRYLPITETLQGEDGISTYGGVGALEDTDEGLKLTFEGSADAGLSVPLVSDGCIDNGDTLTLSFKYRGNITSTGDLIFLQRTEPHVTQALSGALTASDTWQDFTATFTAEEANARTCYNLAIFTGLANYTADNWVEIKYGSLKLEKGNKPTDWSPADEDMTDEETEYIREELNTSATEILQTAENVTMSILAGYTTTEDLNTYKEEVNNLFSASAEGFEFQFNQLQADIDAVGEEIVERNQFIRLEEGNIVIGKSDSPVQATFTNDSLKFTYNGVAVATFTNEVLEVENIAVGNQVRFGSNWAIRPGANGNLNDVWIGG